MQRFMVSNSGDPDMTNFVGTPQCSRIMLTVAMETMYFFIVQKFILKDKNSLHLMGSKHGTI